MSERYDYDPGMPYEPPPRRKRRHPRHEDEADDAWAVADEDDVYDDGVEIEDLAAGYVWEDDSDYGVNRPRRRRRPGATPVFPSGSRRRRRKRSPARRAAHMPNAPRHIPFWQVLLAVVLVMAALFAAVLACSSALLI